jgi:YVTN family beta-propeller protein
MGIGPVKHARARWGARRRTWTAVVACLLVTLSAGQVLASPSAALASPAARAAAGVARGTAAVQADTSGGTAFPLLVTNLGARTVSAIGPTWNVTLDVGTDPSGVAFAPGGHYAYVVNGGSGTVSVISDADTADPVVSQTLTVGTSATGDGAIAVTPDGKYAYVTSANSDTVSVIDDADTSDPVVSSTTLTVGGEPDAVAVTPDGQYAYVVSRFGAVTVIDGASTADPTVGPTVTVDGNGLSSIAITPDGQYAYVTNSSNDNTSGYNVAVIGGVETSSPAVTAQLTVGEFPSAVAITPDGDYAYVTDFTGDIIIDAGVPDNGGGGITVINGASTADPTVGQTLTAVGGTSGGGSGIAISPDGQDAYMTDSGLSTVSEIVGADTASPAVSDSTWPTGDLPDQIAVAPAPAAVAQLGDSIASGEGTLYDYTYDAATGRWSAPGTPNPGWTGDYPLCHDSPDAYGEIVAKDLGGTAPLSQFACTGASYLNGITQPETELAPNGTSIQDRPAELGPPGGPYNSAFTAAKPDVVLVTFGADDVQFVNVVLSCAITNDTNPGLEGSLVHTGCLPCPAGAGRRHCVPGGDVYQKDFVDELPALNTYYGKVVDAIDDALAPGPPPTIVFTDYMNPFPAHGTCPDTAFLSTGQINFLSDALNTLDNDIQSDVEALEANHPNVGFADIRNVLAGHTWCSSAPWDYGLSIDTTPSALWNLLLYKLTGGREGQPASPAPFHPTPDGQQAIAKVVLAQVQQLSANASSG